MRRELSKYVRQAVWPAVGGLLVAYFAYHMVQGERGLISYLRLQADMRAANAALAATTAEREFWQRNVDSLIPEHLDLDVLEERARTMLNHVRDDEVIIFDAPPE